MAKENPQINALKNALFDEDFCINKNAKENHKITSKNDTTQFKTVVGIGSSISPVIVRILFVANEANINLNNTPPKNK